MSYKVIAKCVTLMKDMVSDDEGKQCSEFLILLLYNRNFCYNFFFFFYASAMMGACVTNLEE